MNPASCSLERRGYIVRLECESRVSMSKWEAGGLEV